MNKNIVLEDNAPMDGILLLYGKFLPLRIYNYSDWQPFIELEKIANSQGISFYFNESIIALPIPSLSYPITHKAKIMGMPTFDATFTIICGYIKTESSIILKPLPPMSKKLIKKTIEITKANKDIYLN